VTNQRLADRLRPYVMIAPAMIGIFLFVVYPTIKLLQLSLYDYNLMNKAKSKFIGLNNYIEILSRGDFYKSLENTALYTLGVVVFTMTIAILMALWLQKNSKINFVIQAGLFTPHIVSIVSIALIWLWLMEPNLGFLNFILKTLGLPTSQWLQSSNTALLSIIIVSVWQAIGYYTIIIVAALHGVSPTIYEAAALDRAKRSTVFYKLTLPLISPQLFFILVIMTIGSFKVFDTVRIMTGGGPNNATNTLVYYIYEFRTTNIGYATTSGVILMGIIGVLTLIYFKIISKKIFYQ